MANQFQVNLQLQTGADFYQEFYLRNDDMSPIDLTGITFHGTMQKHSRSVDANSEHSDRVYTKFGTQIVDAANGTYAITLGRADTVNLEEGKYVYDIMMIDAQSHFTPVASGLMFIDAGFGYVEEESTDPDPDTDPGPDPPSPPGSGGDDGGPGSDPGGTPYP